MTRYAHTTNRTIPPRRAETLGISVVLILAAGLFGWWLLHSASAQFSQTLRNARTRAMSTKSFDSLAERIRVIAKESAVQKTLDQWRREADFARRKLDFSTLISITHRMSALLLRLADAYDIRIEDLPDQPNGFVRTFPEETGKLAEYYLIVRASDEHGTPVRRKVVNSETGRSVDVERWAEQVSKEVYDRVAEDKSARGVLTETLFAAKRRGVRNEEVQFKHSDGQPLSRSTQLTDW